MKNALALLVLLSALLVVSVSAGEAQTRFEREILTALEVYVEATNSGDAEAVADLYVDSPATGTVGDGQVYTGWSSVSDLLWSIYAQSGTVQLQAADVTVTPVGSDGAVAYFTADWAFGSPVQSRSRGAMTVVFVRTGQGWKVAHDHTSTLPGTAMSTSPLVGNGPVEPVRLTQACDVTRIVDGDTIDCAPFGRIRLIGMDTPEADQAPFGELATQALASLIPVGSEVLIEPDVEATDQYGRILGYIWSEVGMVNWTMVRAGYAVVLTYPPNVQYVDWFESAQIMARSEEAGLWEIDGFACEPRAHRRGQC